MVIASLILGDVVDFTAFTEVKATANNHEYVDWCILAFHDDFTDASQ